MGREPDVALPSLNICTTSCWKAMASTELLPGLPRGSGHPALPPPGANEAKRCGR